MTLREITLDSIFLRIFIALFLGGIIGLERGMKNRPAGLRTYMLVCVGSCLIMMTNQYTYQIYGVGDPVRMSAQVVSGIGFLGAGTIIVTRHSQIKGLTTAAGLWACAAVGLAVGIGFYEAGLIGGLAIFIILTLLQRWDSRMQRYSKHLEVYIELSSDAALGNLIRQLRQIDVEFSDMQLETDIIQESAARALIVTLTSKHRGNHASLLSQIRKIDGVTYLEEI